MIYLLLLLVLAGCHKPVVRVIDVEPAFNICEPPRGEEQDETRQARGKAFNSLQHGCV